MSILTAIGKVKGTRARLARDSESLGDVTEWISTGFPGLDLIFGGGWPVDKVSELFGPEGSGKSALTHAACRQCQLLGGYVLYIDYERSLTKRIIKQQRLDPTRLIWETPSYIEQGWDIIFATLDRLKVAKPSAPFLIVWDSFGASPAKSQTEIKASGDATPAAQARAISAGCVRLFEKVEGSRAHVLIVNQERTKFGGFGGFNGPQTETTGGRASKYTFHLRAKVARVSTLKRSGNSGPATGYLIKVGTRKNKSAPPHQNATWVLDFAVGPSPELTMWQVLKDFGKLQSVKSGLYRLSFDPEKRPFKKRAGWFEILEDPEFLAMATAGYLEIVRAQDVAKQIQTDVESDDSGGDD